MLAFSPPVNSRVPAFVTPALVIKLLALVLSVAPSKIDTVFCVIVPLFVVVPPVITVAPCPSIPLARVFAPERFKVPEFTISLLLFSNLIFETFNVPLFVNAVSKFVMFPCLIGYVH